MILAAENGHKLTPVYTHRILVHGVTFKIALRPTRATSRKTAYETIVIDTVSLLADLAVQHICNLHGIKELGELEYGKGWTLFKKNLGLRLIKLATIRLQCYFYYPCGNQKKSDTGTL